MPRLENRKILITGGASGIGRATCELFAREGAAVAVLDRSVRASMACMPSPPTWRIPPAWRARCRRQRRRWAASMGW